MKIRKKKSIIYLFLKIEIEIQKIQKRQKIHRKIQQTDKIENYNMKI